MNLWKLNEIVETQESHWISSWMQEMSLRHLFFNVQTRRMSDSLERNAINL
jgi:hypothetical protein